MNAITEEKTNMRVDCHMHTPLCGHAVGEPLEYAMMARERGIDLITVTCHIPMRDPAFGQEGIRMRMEDLGPYRALVRDAAEHAAPLGVEVLCGIEAEVFPDEEEMSLMDGILEDYRFDFVLGSLHAQCASYLEWLRKNKVRDDRMIIDSYFRHLIDGVCSGRYDSMSHPDVIRSYGVVQSFDPTEHEEVIRDFLGTLTEEGVCMEVNTSGLGKGAFEVHPDPVILDWAAEMGVSLTIGSDSHQPTSVGQYFETVLPMLRSKGFRDLYYFREREPHRIDLPVPYSL